VPDAVTRHGLVRIAAHSPVIGRPPVRPRAGGWGRRRPRYGGARTGTLARHTCSVGPEHIAEAVGPGAAFIIRTARRVPPGGRGALAQRRDSRSLSAFVAVTGPGWYPCGDEEMSRSGRSPFARRWTHSKQHSPRSDGLRMRSAAVSWTSRAGRNAPTWAPYTPWTDYGG
jgi:hypothetical protein